MTESENYCQITLQITGIPERLEEFKQLYIRDYEPRFSFSYIKPIPENLQNPLSIQERNVWTFTNWQSFDDAEFIDISFTAEMIRIQFKTPNFPPRKLIQEISQQLQQLTFELTYTDDDEEREGQFIYQNGEEEEVYEYDVDNDDIYDDEYEDEDEQDDLIDQTTIHVEQLFQQPDLTDFNCCPICLIEREQLLTNPDQLTALACNPKHIYCTQCIQGYFDSLGNKKQCPLCRTIIRVL